MLNFLQKIKAKIDGMEIFKVKKEHSLAEFKKYGCITFSNFNFVIVSETCDSFKLFGQCFN